MELRGDLGSGGVEGQMRGILSSRLARLAVQMLR
jgi:hypothetical protein